MRRKSDQISHHSWDLKSNILRKGLDHGRNNVQSMLEEYIYILSSCTKRISEIIMHHHDVAAVVPEVGDVTRFTERRSRLHLARRFLNQN